MNCIFWCWILGCTEPSKETGLVDGLEPSIELNSIQVFGTPNSYHIAPETDAVAEWNYTHASLTDQLDMGIRQFEIDVVRDPDSNEILVQHVPVLDDGSTCYTLMDCLNEYSSWLAEHPNTVPLQILIEPKTEIATWSMSNHMDVLEEVLLEGIGDLVWSVDDQWGDAESLRSSIINNGWPTIGELRGSVILVLLDGGEPFEAYTNEGTEIRDRLMFPLVEGENDWAGYFIRDNPYSDEIPSLHEQGFLVRTRADAGLEYDEDRWFSAYDGYANAISMDTEEGFSHLNPDSPVRVLQ